MKYYKISPEWAKKLNVTDRAPMHPDGWFLLLPTFALPLMRMLPPDEFPGVETLDDAVAAIGGCIYTEEEAKASWRGVPEFMMNRPEVSEEESEEVPEDDPEETPEDVDTEEENGEEVNDGAR